METMISKKVKLQGLTIVGKVDLVQSKNTGGNASKKNVVKATSDREIKVVKKAERRQKVRSTSNKSLRSGFVIIRSFC